MAKIKMTVESVEARRKNGKSGGRPAAMVCKIHEDELEPVEYWLKGERVEPLVESMGRVSWEGRIYSGPVSGHGEFKLVPAPPVKAPGRVEDAEETGSQALDIHYWEIDALTKAGMRAEVKEYMARLYPGGDWQSNKATKVSARAYYRRVMAERAKGK